MKVEISSGEAVFSAETLGAEPWALRLNSTQANYIWRPADNPEKSGGTPLCFPLLGTVPGGSYTLDGKTYQMQMHGFAQHCDFAVTEKSKNAMLLEIHDTPETLSQFPYAFRFQVLYSLDGRTLKTEYRVINDDTAEMYFSVGGHPRFSCPVGSGADGIQFSDYYLEFDRPHSAQDVAKSNGPLETIGRFTGPKGKTLRLDYSLFEKGAFCYSRTDGRMVTLKSEKDKRSLTMQIEGNAFLSVWGVPGMPFIALEPWYGSISSLPFNAEIDGNWKARPGSLVLKPGKSYSAVFYISIA